MYIIYKSFTFQALLCDPRCQAFKPCEMSGTPGSKGVRSWPAGRTPDIVDGFKFYARKISEIHTTAINASEHDRCVGMIPLRTLAFFAH